MGNSSAIDPSVNTYLANASCKWPHVALGTLRRLHNVVLHMVFLPWSFFFSFHLYKLFYDEGGGAEGEGPEEGLEFHRIQPGAFFGAQRELCPTFLSTGTRRNGS